jgi:uncharacterized protein (DUF2147 family)
MLMRSAFPTSIRAVALASLLIGVPLARGNAQSAAATSPVGKWHTISDVDGKPRGVVEIREEKGVFIGTARGTLRQGEPPNPTCDRCPGDRKGKPILGLDILTGLRADGNEWTGGEILDPDTGKVYKAKIKLIDGGKKLVLRGFVGISLIGRSQTWVRAE